MERHRGIDIFILKFAIRIDHHILENLQAKPPSFIASNRLRITSSLAGVFVDGLRVLEELLRFLLGDDKLHGPSEAIEERVANGSPRHSNELEGTIAVPYRLEHCPENSVFPHVDMHLIGNYQTGLNCPVKSMRYLLLSVCGLKGGHKPHHLPEAAGLAQATWVTAGDNQSVDFKLTRHLLRRIAQPAVSDQNIMFCATCFRLFQHWSTARLKCGKQDALPQLCRHQSLVRMGVEDLDEPNVTIQTN